MSSLLARCRSTTFVALWLFVIFVSVYDGYLALRHRHTLAIDELNPLGQWLLAANGGQVWLLLAAKFAGTVAAASVVLLIYAGFPRLGLPIAAAVAGSQLALLLFLLLA